MSKGKLSIGVMIATLVAVMALFFLPSPPRQSVTIATITPGATQVACMLEGVAISGQQQLMIAPSAGRIDKVYVQSGDKVTAGQLLARMDTRLEERALAQLDQQWHGWRRRADDAGDSGLNLLSGFAEQRAGLIAAIECKQIRAAEDGTVENVHVTEGMYLSEAGMIGSLVGQQPKVTAFWMAQQGQTPAPGMTAWWCAQDGTYLEPLVLESVGAPVMQENALVYLLSFTSVMGESSIITGGDEAPVCLLLEQEAAPAVAPIEAVDEDGFLWLLRDGAAVPVPANGQPYDDGFLQVQPELLGQQVILWPDRLSLQEGLGIKHLEGM